MALVYRSIASSYFFALKAMFPCSFMSSAVGSVGFSRGDSIGCVDDGEMGPGGFDSASGCA